MGFITAAVVVGAAAMGAQAYSARKQRRGAERDMRRQETTAREAMALDNVREDSGADIQLGTETDQTSTARKRRRVAAKTPAGETPAKTGGLGNASSLLGETLFGVSK